jgi:phage baseplate assembly protein W
MTGSKTVKTSELDYLINLDPTVGVVWLEGYDAMNNRIREWLATPEGTIADLPAWGHNLIQFRHDPLDRMIETKMRVAIFQKLPIDIPDLDIHDVNIEAASVDRANIWISHGFGVFRGQIER